MRMGGVGGGRGEDDDEAVKEGGTDEGDHMLERGRNHVAKVEMKL